MSLQSTTKELKDLLVHLSHDLEKADGGNKAASQRVRTGTVKLEKVAKQYRKESILIEKKTKGTKKPAKKVAAKSKSAAPTKSAAAKPAATKPTAAKPVAAKPAAGKAKPAVQPAAKPVKSAKSAKSTKAKKTVVKARPLSVKIPTCCASL